MKNIIICFLALAYLSAKGQEFTHDFGKYSSEEFMMTKYSKDTTAEAVVIYDIGKSFFMSTDYGFQIIFERRTKIKIFTKAGLRWAEFEIPIYHDKDNFEKFYDLRGNTYNFENGTIRETSLDPKNTYTEKYNEHWNNSKFAMPDVKEGSIIEVEYRIETPYIFNFRNWEFQKQIPVIYSEYNAKMIPFYEYSYILQGTSKLDKFNKYEEGGISNRFAGIEYHDMVYEFILKDIPAFKDEAFITSSNDYIIKLDFQLSAIHRPEGANEEIMTTWPKLVNEMLDHESFGKYVKDSQKKAKNITDTMLISIKDTLEKAKYIEKYVKTNFSWNGHMDKFATKSVKDFLKTKTGNCADINLFLTGVLRAGGIDASPVIISTRDHGKIKTNYPFHHFFNYVVVMVRVGGESIILDATEPLSSFGEIPKHCLNDKGLLIKKDAGVWISYSSSVNSSVRYNSEIFINDTSEFLTSIFKIESTGYDALNLRKNFSSSSSIKKELSLNALTLSDSLASENLDEIQKPLKINFNTRANYEKVENKIIISPFSDIVITENPLKQVFRTYPIDMVYKRERVFNATIHIPNGYKLLQIPKSLLINNNLVKITYKAETADDKTIRVIGVYEFKQDVYGASDYFDIKGYFNKIVSLFNEKIILEKS